MTTGSNMKGSTKFHGRCFALLPARLQWNALSQISDHILSQRRLRTSDKNFENILFANVNFEVFDAELRKRKQPERDDDVE